MSRIIPLALLLRDLEATFATTLQGKDKYAKTYARSIEKKRKISRFKIYRREKGCKNARTSDPGISQRIPHGKSDDTSRIRPVSATSTPRAHFFPLYRVSFPPKWAFGVKRLTRHVGPFFNIPDRGRRIAEINRRYDGIRHSTAISIRYCRSCPALFTSRLKIIASVARVDGRSMKYTEKSRLNKSMFCSLARKLGASPTASQNERAHNIDPNS